MIAIKTKTGLQVLKDRSVPLLPRQRAAFILVDGKRSIEEVLSSTATMGVTQADIDYLLALGLVAVVTVPELFSATLPLVVRVGARTRQQRYSDAYLVAKQLTANMGLRGFMLNLAVEAAGSFEQLSALAPKIQQAVGDDKFEALRKALDA